MECLRRFSWFILTQAKHFQLQNFIIIVFIEGWFDVSRDVKDFVSFDMDNFVLSGVM